MALLIFNTSRGTVATTNWTAAAGRSGHVCVFYQDSETRALTLPVTMDQFLGRNFAGIIDLRDLT